MLQRGLDEVEKAKETAASFANIFRVPDIDLVNSTPSLAYLRQDAEFMELLRKAGVPGPTGLRAEFSEYQPNSIFTYQGCTSDEIYTAMLMAERKVERKLGVKLERSLTLIGSFRDLTL